MKNTYSLLKKWLLIGGGVLLLLYIANLNLTINRLSADPSGYDEIYYVAQNISQGTIIEQDMLGTFLIPRENVAEVMFTTGEEANLLGQAARYNLDHGTILTASMIGTSLDAVHVPVTLAVISVRPITEGQMITSEDLSMDFLQSITPNAASIFYYNPAEIIGCRSKMSINANEPVTKNMVTDCFDQIASNQFVGPGESVPSGTGWGNLISAILGMLLFELGRYIYLRYYKNKDKILDAVSIVVSSKAISKDTPVESEMVIEFSIPRKKYSSSMITNREDVIGKSLMFSISEGVVLTKSMILETSEITWQVNNGIAQLDN